MLPCLYTMSAKFAQNAACNYQAKLYICIPTFRENTDCSTYLQAVKLPLSCLNVLKAAQKSMALTTLTKLVSTDPEVISFASCKHEAVV